ncbi:MAG: hypothetical protein AAB726_03750 [Patescibacteria group bacterium]
MRFLKFILAFCFIGALILGAYILLLVVTKDDTREPNQDEWNYFALAVNSNYEPLCHKISPKAVTSAFFNPRKFRTAYLQSSCIFNVAVNSKDISLCTDSIRPYKSISLFAGGSGYNKNECASQVGTRLSTTAVSFAPNGSPEEIMKKMGYTEGDVPESFKSYNDGHPGFYWLDFFFEVKTSPEFRERMDKLPAYIE